MNEILSSFYCRFSNGTKITLHNKLNSGELYLHSNYESSLSSNCIALLAAIEKSLRLPRQLRV